MTEAAGCPAEARAERLKWYEDAKFGLFIHWGPYSQAGVEASWPIMTKSAAKMLGGRQLGEKEYLALPSTFNPVDFDADDWVRKAKAAGMRYLVFTSKHHDGFCMFDAPGTDYKITNTPFGRDIVRELADACDRQSFGFGLYYSPPDMHHHGYRDTSVSSLKNWEGQPSRPQWREYLDYMEEHLRYLLTEYPNLRLLWFDGLVEQDKYEPERFHRMIRSLRPDVLINDRLGDSCDFITTEQGLPSAVPVVSDTKGYGITAKQFKRLSTFVGLPVIRNIIRKSYSAVSEEPKPLFKFPVEDYPDEERFQPWEGCMTMNKTYAYNPDDESWKPSDLLLRMLCRVAARGGNFLLNVGPSPDGVFPVEADDRLAFIGGWMDGFGEAVYGTTYGLQSRIKDVVVTRRGLTSYLMILKKPETLSLNLPHDFSCFGRAEILGGGTVALEPEDGGVCLKIPGDLDFSLPVVVRLN